VIEDVGNDLAHQLPHRRKSSGGYRPPCQVWGARHTSHGSAPPPPSRLSPSPLLASIAAVSRKTYAIEDSGPFDEDEVREKIRAYCDEHGLHATLGLTVIEMTEGGTTGGRVDAGQFLD
jgi:hypothetical protein